MPEATNNIFEMTRRGARRRRHQDAAGHLGEAIELFEKSELMKEVLGEHIHTFYVREQEGRVGRLHHAGHRVGARPLPEHLRCAREKSRSASTATAPGEAHLVRRFSLLTCGHFRGRDEAVFEV